MLKIIKQKCDRLSFLLTRNLVVKKILSFIFFVLLGIILFVFTPLKTVLDTTLFKNFIQQYEGYVEIIFIAIYTFLTIVGIPGTILTLVGGCLFGLWHGTLISIASASLGALGGFLVARYLLQDFAQRRFRKSKQLSKFQAAVLDRPFSFVLTTRLIPISPFNLVNYLFGLTTINWLDYTFATFIGVIPGSFAYTWLGVSGEKAMMGGEKVSFYLALTFLAALSIVPLLFGKKKQV